MSSVYIHIPFCKYICTYCDFCKKYKKNQDILAYLDALDQEILKQIPKKKVVSTIYIGGGTPSSLTIIELKRLSKIIKEHFIFDENYEYTFEMNPDDVSNEKMQLLVQMGVNRISIGMQTLNNELLVSLKREHTVLDCENAIQIASKYIENISIDLIFNLPKQTKEDIKINLDFIKRYKQIKHVSFYGLILEENTILDTQKFKLLAEDIEASWYYIIQEELSILGYEQYEISNYTKKGYKSIHNLVYWQNKEYYGFGLGASGYINQVRYTNTHSLSNYLKGDILWFKEKINHEEYLYEEVMLKLRTIEGIEFKKVEKYYLDKEYFQIKNDYVSIKPNKLYLSNEAIVKLLEQMEEK